MEQYNRTSTHEFWMFLAAFFLAWTVRATYLFAVDEAIASPVLRQWFSILIKLALWVLPAFVFIHWVRRRSPLLYVGLTAWPTQRQWLVSLVVTALFLGVTVLVEWISGRKLPSLGSPHVSVTSISILSLLISPLLEEVLFRGLVLRELLNDFTRWGANVIASLLFVAIHLPFWLWHDGMNTALLRKCPGIFTVGLLTGWLFMKTGSIWPAVIAHSANNGLAAVLGVR